MHFEVLVEDESGRIALLSILEKILGPYGQPHSYRIHPYRGIGDIPPNLKPKQDPQKRILLDQLPRLLRGYGNSLKHSLAAVVVVVDLDRRDCKKFKEEMLDVLNSCHPKPTTLFRIAIEECEAWLLGDPKAVKTAYPRADDRALKGYVQDSICDTWEKLADAIYPGGSKRLKGLGYPLIGKAKCQWAEKITPFIDADRNGSKSFQVFRDGIRVLTGMAVPCD